MNRKIWKRALYAANALVGDTSCFASFSWISRENDHQDWAQLKTCFSANFIFRTRITKNLFFLRRWELRGRLEKQPLYAIILRVRPWKRNFLCGATVSDWSVCFPKSAVPWFPTLKKLPYVFAVQLRCICGAFAVHFIWTPYSVHIAPPGLVPTGMVGVSVEV